MSFVDFDVKTMINNCLLLFLFFSKSGFMCVMFYRRDTHVAELQMGTPAARLEDACTTENFDVHRTPFVTLLGNLAAPRSKHSN